MRVVDSRALPYRVGVLSTWSGGQTQGVAVTGGVSGVPGSASSVVLNVTVTGGSTGGFLTLWPQGAARPTASSLNFLAGQTISNQVTVKVGEGGVNAGMVSVFNYLGSTDVVVDVNGFYDGSVGDGFVSQAPVRIVDSRALPYRVGLLSTWSGGQTQVVAATGGVSGVPVDADAVVLNVTATGGSAANFLKIWPTGLAQPNVSSLNFAAGETIANAVTVKVGSGINAGKISIFNFAGVQNVIVDVAGYFKAGTGKAFFPLAPVRIVDSRPAPYRVGALGSWGPGVTQGVNATGVVSGVPVDADSVVANLTATGGTAPSFLTMWPTGQSVPNASSLNFLAGQTIPNAVTVKLGSAPYVGVISVLNYAGTTNAIIDIAGYYR